MSTHIASLISSAARKFIDSVLELRPRIAVFDCDGTLWDSDSGELFYRWELENNLLDERTAQWLLDRYASYKRGDVSEDDMCGEMVTVHAGLSVSDLERAVARYFPEKIAPTIFPEMLVLTRALAEQGCDLWAVSSTNDWVVREGVKDFGIPPDHVLAACVHCEDGVATDRLLRVPSGVGKALAINEVVGTVPDAAFGNSIFDEAMLTLARSAFAVNPNPDLEVIARNNNWTIYHPDGKLT
jgi:phosphoserine phosphatase